MTPIQMTGFCTVDPTRKVGRGSGGSKTNLAVARHASRRRATRHRPGLRSRIGTPIHASITARPFATLYASNLTAGQGGALNRYDDAGFAKAIRHGIRHDGRSLIIMPSPEYNHLSDEDVGSIVAWIRRAPPVDNVTPEPKFGPVGRVLLATGQLDAMLVAGLIDHDTPHRPAPPAGPTVEYGEYLARVCAGCHMANYAGAAEGGPDGSPPALNLTPAGRVGTWSLEEFRTAMRTGATPNGYELNAQFMPWPALGQATDEELEAIYNFLRSLPPAQPAQ